MLKMNLITQKELRGDLCWELDRELYGELYLELWELGTQIRIEFLHSKISRV